MNMKIELQSINEAYCRKHGLKMIFSVLVTDGVLSIIAISSLRIVVTDDVSAFHLQCLTALIAKPANLSDRFVEVLTDEKRSLMLNLTVIKHFSKKQTSLVPV